MSHLPGCHICPHAGPVLAVWIGAAIAAGLLLGRLVPDLNSGLNQVAIHGTALILPATLRVFRMAMILGNIHFGGEWSGIASNLSPSRWFPSSGRTAWPARRAGP